MGHWKIPVSTSMTPGQPLIPLPRDGVDSDTHADGPLLISLLGAIGDSQSHRVLRVGSLIVLKIGFIDYLSVLSPFDSWPGGFYRRLPWCVGQNSSANLLLCCKELPTHPINIIGDHHPRARRSAKKFETTNQNRGHPWWSERTATEEFPTPCNSFSRLRKSSVVTLR